jgi:thermitase
MQRVIGWLVLLILPVVLVPAISSGASVSPRPRYVPDEVLVRLQRGLALTDTASVVDSAGGQPARLVAALQQAHAIAAEPVGGGVYRVRLAPGGNVEAVAAHLARRPEVVVAQPNYTRQVLLTPNDPAVGEQWALHRIQLFDAWNYTTGGDIIIAVIDTGVSSDHPDLAGKVLPGYNAILDNNHAEDDHGHGTAIAGLIAAQTNNGQGVAGACWGCTILPVKVLDSYGMGEDAHLARGIRWATDQGARVINLSMGGVEDSTILREAVGYAYEQGVLVVAASGNDHLEGNFRNYPAAFPEVVAVGATDTMDTITDFSTTGDYVDLTAPGVELLTTIPYGDYGRPGGTSFSSPFVAGVAGLIMTLRTDLSHADVACVLAASADDQGAPGKDNQYGWGRLNAARAVEMAQSYTACPLGDAAPLPPLPAPEVPTPAPEVPAPAVPSPPGNAFAPVPAIPSTPTQHYVPQTQHTLRGAFFQYWQRYGREGVFGWPISEEFVEMREDGRVVTVQYFERFRFELHPERPAPHHVQLGRMGDRLLVAQGRNWFTFPKGSPQPGCLFFEGTGHSLCGVFLDFWRSHGLESDGVPGTSFDESMALFGQPLSEPQREMLPSGVEVWVQWFERARFEDHGPNGVHMGLIGRELAALSGLY